MMDYVPYFRMDLHPLTSHATGLLPSCLTLDFYEEVDLATIQSVLRHSESKTRRGRLRSQVTTAPLVSLAGRIAHDWL